MLESFLYCRDRFLRPGGIMIPHAAVLYAAPFGDPLLHGELALASTGPGFWGAADFFGVDLRSALPFVEEERYRQTVVDFVDPRCLHLPAGRRAFDLQVLRPEELEHVVVDLDTGSMGNCTVLHGICCWFEASLGPRGGVLS